MADFTPYLSCTRASIGYAQTVAGDWVEFAANTLRRTDKGLLVEEARTNYLLNSGAPATQTTASLSTGTYCLWVEGTGSALASGGTATITGAASATEGSPDIFTVTVAGTVTVTVSGSLDRFQLEAGAYPTSYIPTTGATATRAQDAVQLIGAADTIAEAPAVSAVVSMDLIPNANCRILRGGSPNMDFISVHAHNQINNYSPTPGTLASGVLPDNSTTAAKYGVAVTKAGGRSITGNGISVASDSGNNEFLELYLGSIPGAGFAVDTYIRRLSLWNTRLSDADLEDLTA